VARAGSLSELCRRYVGQRVDAVIYQRIDELFRDGHRRGLLPMPVPGC
jgi:hypothetical protein